MSRARECFDDGEDAFHDDVERDNCPHPEESDDGSNWLAGWDAAEYENELAVEGQREDHRLDDPRHGQARDLNRGR